MTAFARVDGDGYCWEIRSLNNRGFDVRVKLPDSLLELESHILESIRKSVTRGRIEVTLKTNPPSQKSPQATHRQVASRLKEFNDHLHELPSNVVPSIDLLSLLRFVDSNSDTSLPENYDAEEILTSFQSALDKFHSERQREGEFLKKVVLDRVRLCRETVVQLDEKSRDQIRFAQQTLDERLKLLDVNVDPTRLAQEVALIAQRTDTSEELDRLKVHLEEIATRTSDTAPSGRRLSFLAQELGREANTLASKAQTPEAALLAVDLKVYVDQIREQVQNIE